MESEPFYEPINLLVLAENDEFRDTFIEDLKGFLQSENYKPADNKSEYTGKTTFSAFFRDFCILTSPIILKSDTPKDISTKLHNFQEQFFLPINLNAIIILMQADPRCYEHFLFINLFNNFTKKDMAKIEKNLMFVFVHDDSESYRKRDIVDAALWTSLDRIGADLFHSKTFHWHSRCDKDFHEAFLQFIYTYKKTLLVETVYSHESVLNVVGNEDFLEMLLEALIVSERNLHMKAISTECHLTKHKNYVCKCTYHKMICCYCSEITAKSHLTLCEALINTTCTQCNCSINNHEAVKYSSSLLSLGSKKTEQVNKYHRRLLMAIMVAIDLFNTKNNVGVDLLCNRLKERIKKEPDYSILESLYKNEMDCSQKEVTADDCMKCIWKLLPSFMGYSVVEEEFKNCLLLCRRNLCVSVQSSKSPKHE